MAGKGGVGKTTVGASLALAAGRAGLDVLIIELDVRPQLATVFSAPALEYSETILWTDPDGGPGQVRGRRITPDNALLEYLKVRGLDRIGARLIRSGAIDVVATATPGIQDLLMLGKIGNLEREDPADVIIVDAPAAGHALTFLTSAHGMNSALTGSGPLQEQSGLVKEMLNDESRSRVQLTTLPEETPVTEIIETAYGLEDQVGVKLAPVVVNALWTKIPGLTPKTKAGAFRVARTEHQHQEVARLTKELPLPQLKLPFLFTTQIGLDELGELASLVTIEIEALQ